jgi:hypothetical protein
MWECYVNTMGMMDNISKICKMRKMHVVVVTWYFKLPRHGCSVHKELRNWCKMKLWRYKCITKRTLRQLKFDNVHNTTSHKSQYLWPCCDVSQKSMKGYKITLCSYKYIIKLTLCQWKFDKFHNTVANLNISDRVVVFHKGL